MHTAPVIYCNRKKDADMAFLLSPFYVVPQSAAAAIPERLSMWESVGCTEPPVRIRAF